jgi:2-succinyl-5-enolpyruvyl-6-hydroxy-3-cyclohexene-1-carboxylate synthase
VARALGHGGCPGPVHVNVAFREPTVPALDDGRSAADPYLHPIEGRGSGVGWQEHVRARPGAGALPLTSGDRGLVVAGEGDFDQIALYEAARRLRWPLLATAASGLRGSDVITAYHHLLVEEVPLSLRPDMVVTVGRVGPSDRIGRLTRLDVPQIQIDRWGAWNDPRRHATRLLQSDPVATLESVAAGADGSLLAAWIDANARMREALDDRIEGEGAATGPLVARGLSEVGYDRLVVASSMPVRDVDAHTIHHGPVFANRGASGIDGFVSTALGAASLGGRTLGLAGDLSMLHDAGGLISEGDDDVVFAVIDNGGGGLFDLLPTAEHAPGFDRLFVTPHGLDLAAVAAAYRVEAAVVDDPIGLIEVLAGSFEAGGRRIVIIPVERETDLKLRRALDDTAREISAGLS